MSTPNSHSLNPSKPKHHLRASPFTSNGLTDEKHAESLARHFFQFYSKKQSGTIEAEESRHILMDIYKSIGVDFEPSEEDIGEYMEILDIDRDGRITLADIEAMMKRFLV
jgi:Ca2+-binding EF-hand superfamily protein